MCLMNVMVRTLMSYLSYTEIRGFLMLLLCVPCDSCLCFCGTEHFVQKLIMPAMFMVPIKVLMW